MENYKHAVQPAIHREVTKMFIACKALHFIPVFFRFFLFLKLKFFPGHSFDRMAGRLSAMDRKVGVAFS